MKWLNIIIINFYILFSLNLSAQDFIDIFLDFDEPDSMIYIDTTEKENIWQIGNPSKIIFNKAISLPNAILTDTINYYPVNNYSEFYITMNLKKDTLFIFRFFNISFVYKINSDSLNDFGMIEVSFDDGLTWLNLISDHSGKYFNWNTKPLLSGSINKWEYLNCDFKCENKFMQDAETAIFRFSFHSDSINNNKEGWMIDNIRISAAYKHIGINKNNHEKLNFVFPNPVSSCSIITIDNIKENILSMQVYNYNGQLIKQLNNKKKNLYIINSDYSKGLYLLQIQTKKNIYLSKFIIN
ncbi:MAG: T9SS type A sorting domain-containing protein [Bacteroidota bacterium]|nr:T9SS type A sorting domain-containing protein [Bacteroidota bacterium]